MICSIVENIKENFKYDCGGWSFEVKEFNEIQGAYRIVAEKSGLVEAMFVEAKYLQNEEALKKECNRFYENTLSSLE